uniref:Uncharacterized protein n=1 Tax=Rhizophora mucronata TaxID=61149 RepID=A0A2P2LF64_RHIMU
MLATLTRILQCILNVIKSVSSFTIYKFCCHTWRPLPASVQPANQGLSKGFNFAERFHSRKIRTESRDHDADIGTRSLFRIESSHRFESTGFSSAYLPPLGNRYLELVHVIRVCTDILCRPIFCQGIKVNRRKSEGSKCYVEQSFSS